MKPSSATHPLIPVAAWQHKPKTKDAVLERIKTITRELEAIQAEMHGQLTESADNKISRFFEDSTAVQVLSHFKAELDQLRRILWFYIEAAAQETPTGMDQEQARRLERVTGLLRALSPQPNIAPVGEQSGSFFERLNLVIDNYMQEKKPVAAESKAAPRKDLKAFS
ncbi:MAG TPA: hypothetical protein VKL99_10885 [Candidatus Angelobacter sp.]|nr:hypothetical protein [Candidatus Angelobacter sp.]